jgi:hypothetical protein
MISSPHSISTIQSETACNSEKSQRYLLNVNLQEATLQSQTHLMHETFFNKKFFTYPPNMGVLSKKKLDFKEAEGEFESDKVGIPQYNFYNNSSNFVMIDSSSEAADNVNQANGDMNYLLNCRNYYKINKFDFNYSNQDVKTINDDAISSTSNGDIINNNSFKNFSTNIMNSNHPSSATILCNTISPNNSKISSSNVCSNTGNIYEYNNLNYVNYNNGSPHMDGGMSQFNQYIKLSNISTDMSSLNNYNQPIYCDNYYNPNFNYGKYYIDDNSMKINLIKYDNSLEGPINNNCNNNGNISNIINNSNTCYGNNNSNFNICNNVNSSKPTNQKKPYENSSAKLSYKERKKEIKSIKKSNNGEDENNKINLENVK